MLRYLTAGESHGDRLVAIIEGFPANVKIDLENINRELKRRQMGYGRSERMELESDRVEIISGLRNNMTTGNPISFTIENKGKNIELTELKNPRPGHADLVGLMKYNQGGGRNTLERASARETALRVAVGAFSREFLREFEIDIKSHIIGIGSKSSPVDYYNNLDKGLLDKVDESSLRIVHKDFEEEAIREINRAKEAGDSLGGYIEVIVSNLPLGLGSYTNWDRKLDALLAYNLMGIQAIKSVEFGLGLGSASFLGSDYQDEIYYDGGIKRYSNYAGGIEGGVSNGEDLVIRLSMKPIPTLKKGLRTINIDSKKEAKTHYERSDVLALPACSVVCENVVALVLMDEILKLTGGDFMEEIIDRYNKYLNYLKEK